MYISELKTKMRFPGITSEEYTVHDSK